MRVHGDKHICRRKGIGNLKRYQEAKGMLEEDFHYLCGYCGKNEKIMRETFHIDHFVPKTIDDNRVNDYYNLVLSCPQCNLHKSNKWPTQDKDLSHNKKEGFVDPASDEFDLHMQRDEQGFVVGITEVGRSMCRMLQLDKRRTDLFWKINRLWEILTELRKYFDNGMLTETEKDYYIRCNNMYNDYLDAAFNKGE